jgi:hypothetical protein
MIRALERLSPKSRAEISRCGLAGKKGRESDCATCGWRGSQDMERQATIKKGGRKETMAGPWQHEAWLHSAQSKQSAGKGELTPKIERT